MFSEALCWQARNLFSSPIKAETLLAMERSRAQEQDVGCSALSAPAGIHRSIMSLSLRQGAHGHRPPDAVLTSPCTPRPQTSFSALNSVPCPAPALCFRTCTVLVAMRGFVPRCNSTTPKEKCEL